MYYGAERTSPTRSGVPRATNALGLTIPPLLLLLWADQMID
jgi:hypothetical protein